MQTSPNQKSPHQHSSHQLPLVEFVPLIAALMALVALSIDIMLPTLPNIARSYALADPNAPQLVITSYMGGFALGQIMWGPASDRLGRRPVLLFGLAIYLAGAAGALLSGSFGTLLFMRAMQGLGAAAPRVISLAIVRDIFSGRPMARVMSFVMMVFLVVPVFAPLLGQTLAHEGGWRSTFYALTIFGLVVLVWAGIRLPETRHDDDRKKARSEALMASFASVLSNRQTVGYTIAAGFLFGCLMAYISSAQQIFVDVFKLGDAFPIVFGVVAAVMIPASITNSRLVMRLGMRRLSQTALLGFVASAAGLAMIALMDEPPLLPFCLFLAGAFFCFGMIQPTFNALAMEPLNTDSGTGSSLIGFYQTGAAALIGWFIGHLFDGTVMPLAVGFLACALATFLVVVATEGPDNMFKAGAPP
ncbi:MAG: multidrug effflux MFS transporter [Hyphomicrobiaceae bacterium]